MSSTLKAHGTAIVILAVLLVGVVLGFVLNESLTPQRPSATSNVVVSSQTTSQTTQMPQYVRIVVEATLSGSQWSRNSSTDLPEYAASVTYVIRNEGTANASETQISIQVDSAAYRNYSVPLLAGGSRTDSLTLTFEYDTTHQVAIEASCGQSSDRVSLNINADLPRSLLKPYGAPSAETLALSKLFITPNDPDVKRTLYQAMTNYVWYHLAATYDPRISYPDWIILNAMEDWVANNVRYASDSDIHGVSDYAQLPRETLQLRTGDAKDYSILLVSLLRAAGINEDKAFVVLGTNGTTCYGWLRLNIGGTWQRVVPEPYYPYQGFHSIFGDLPQIDRPVQYEAVYYFNDAEAVQL